MQVPEVIKMENKLLKDGKRTNGIELESLKRWINKKQKLIQVIKNQYHIAPSPTRDLKRLL